MSNYLNSFQMNDHHALVTGAGRGLGEACALALAEAGAEITLVARSSDQLESVAEQIRDSGGQASVHPADLTKMEEIRKLEELGPFTILVNNAGINRPQSFEEVKENDFDDVLDLNVKSAFFVAQSVARGMIRAGRGGSIINMASTVNLMPTKGMTLPFISYGGSSLLALAFGMGMLLALTRRRSGGVE